MNIENAIKNRRSIRRYKPKKVPRKLLEKILDSARWAPSLHNLQPWKFLVLEGKMKEKLLEVMKVHKGKEPLIIRLTLKGGIETIKSAPVVILVYNNGILSNKVKKGGRFIYNNVNICEVQSIACAIQNMLLTAHSLGLGSAWIGIPLFREKKINRLFGVKDRLMAILTVGYPAEKPKAPIRKPLSEIVSFKSCSKVSFSQMIADEKMQD